MALCNTLARSPGKRRQLSPNLAADHLQMSKGKRLSQRWRQMVAELGVLAPLTQR